MQTHIEDQTLLPTFTGTRALCQMQGSWSRHINPTCLPDLPCHQSLADEQQDHWAKGVKFFVQPRGSGPSGPSTRGKGRSSQGFICLPSTGIHATTPQVINAFVRVICKDHVFLRSSNAEHTILPPCRHLEISVKQLRSSSTSLATLFPWILKLHLLGGRQPGHHPIWMLQPTACHTLPMTPLLKAPCCL